MLTELRREVLTVWANIVYDGEGDTNISGAGESYEDVFYGYLYAMKHDSGAVGSPYNEPYTESYLIDRLFD